MTNMNYNDLLKLAREEGIIEKGDKPKKDELLEKIYTAKAEEAGMTVNEYKEFLQKAKEAENNVPKRNKQTIRDKVKDMTKLRRIILHNNNTREQELNGALVTVENDLVSITRFIPFDVPWHVEDIVYKHLKTKVYQDFKTTNKNYGSNSKDFKEGYTKKAYTVEDLPPLTKDELEVLAKQQQLKDEGRK